MSLQSELKKIRKHLEATREELPSSPEMLNEITFKKALVRRRLDQEQLATENQAKSWCENKESK